MSLFDPLNKNQFLSKSSDKYRVNRVKYINLKNSGKCLSPEDEEEAWQLFLYKWFPQIHSNLESYHHEFFMGIPITINSQGIFSNCNLPTCFQWANSIWPFPDLDDFENLTVHFNLCAIYCDVLLSYTGIAPPLHQNTQLNISANSDFFNQGVYGAVAEWDIQAQSPVNIHLWFVNNHDDFKGNFNTAVGSSQYTQTLGIPIIDPKDGNLGFTYTLDLRRPDQLFVDNYALFNINVQSNDFATDPMINNEIIFHFTIDIVGNKVIDKPTK